MFCPACGKGNNDSSKFCSSCGRPLNQPYTITVVHGSWIPRNACTLWAYYLGMASLVPALLAGKNLVFGRFGIGFLEAILILPIATIGIPPMILGFKALKLANAKPELKGKKHAWVGIISGGFSVFFILCALSLVVSKVF